MFNWFNANGGTSRPIVAVNAVGVSTVIGKDLKSPNVWEYAVGVNYTLSRTSGNIDGETAAGPGGAVVSQYPEYKQASWNYPDGDLAVDQRHRVRLWANYTPTWMPNLTLSALQILESGVPYGAVSTGVNPQNYVTNPGYQTPPNATNTLSYFTARDAFRTEGQERADLAATYRYTLRRAHGVQLFAQLQVLNVLNRYQLCACGAATVAADAGRCR